MTFKDQIVEPKIKYWPLGIAAATFIGIQIFPVFTNPVVNDAFSIFSLAAILWISEAIPLALTALTIPALSVLLGVLPAASAFSQFANPVIFLFMGGFVLAGALSAQSLDRIIAQKLIKIAKGNFYYSAILLMLSTSILACWISNTSSAAMMIPMALGLLGLTKTTVMTQESKFLMLGIAYSANIGGVITMIASPPNAIGAEILKLSFTEWLAYGLPIFLITFPAMVLIMTLYFKPDRKLIIEEFIAPISKSRFRSRVAVIFSITVVLWMLESVIAPLMIIASGFSAVVALFAIFMLFVLKVMKWQQILLSIRWDILLLFGGGLTLGLLIESSGLGEILISKILIISQELHFFFFLWLIVLFSILLTEFMSNTASAALILPLLYTLATQAHINPLLVVLPATIAASYGFMLPVGTPPNAMVFLIWLYSSKTNDESGSDYKSELFNNNNFILLFTNVKLH